MQLGILLHLSLILFVTPQAFLLMENGLLPEETVVLLPGDTYAGAAPLEFKFQANQPSESSTLRFEWQFAQDYLFENILFTRFSDETTYVFHDSGTYYVRLLYTDTETEETIDSDFFVIQITESLLEVPNAFSPNGDGVNDVFKVKHQSLKRFNACVVNRWGQEVYRWGLENIDEGWDGTSHGKPAKEGVYFIVVEAEGADGVTYNHKGDINLLR